MLAKQPRFLLIAALVVTITPLGVLIAPIDGHAASSAKAPGTAANLADDGLETQWSDAENALEGDGFASADINTVTKLDGPDVLPGR